MGQDQLIVGPVGIKEMLKMGGVSQYSKIQWLQIAIIILTHLLSLAGPAPEF